MYFYVAKGASKKRADSTQINSFRQHKTVGRRAD